MNVILSAFSLYQEREKHYQIVTCEWMWEKESHRIQECWSGRAGGGGWKELRWIAINYHLCTMSKKDWKATKTGFSRGTDTQTLQFFEAFLFVN
jgi:hypothetical protein